MVRAGTEALPLHSLTPDEIAIDNKIEHEIRSKSMLNELFKSMLNNLMTGQVRVKDIDFGNYL
jgi:hypothetical protein